KKEPSVRNGSTFFILFVNIQEIYSHSIFNYYTPVLVIGIFTTNVGLTSSKCSST
ncbi:unnamed protein product, partial [Tenebrio molitor]